jgi:phosphate starvation-inducible protein PhoH and related proteins
MKKMHAGPHGEIPVRQPMTLNQKKAFDAWDDGHNLFLSGSAGTGKTFIALYLAMKELANNPDKYRKVMIVRSVVPTRDSGALPGTKEEKEDPYKIIYRSLMDEICGYDDAYKRLSARKNLEFVTTSYIRGATFDQTLIVVDEMQNLNFHELDSVITRIGEDCRIIFAGDHRQTDFKHRDEKIGIVQFRAIVEQMRFFRCIDFEWADIVRSDFVRDYIMTKEMLGITE